jgi:uncharacterized protein YkwD
MRLSPRLLSLALGGTLLTSLSPKPAARAEDAPAPPPVQQAPDAAKPREEAPAAKPSEKPAEKPAEAAKPAAPAKPAAEPQPAGAPAETKPSAPPDATSPAEAARPAEAPAPAEVPKPGETVRPAEPATAAKPVDGARPVDRPGELPVETVLPSGPAKMPASLAGLPQETDEEQQFVALVNQEREKRGLGRLEIDPLLIAVARQHSAEMRDRNYFNHQSPTVSLKTPMDRYLKALYTRPGYLCVGENLFYCSIIDVQRGHTAFMTSPTHRDNVLFPRYEKIGVGIVKNGKGEFWVTQMFLTTRDPVVTAKMSSSRSN